MLWLKKGLLTAGFMLLVLLNMLSTAKAVLAALTLHDLYSFQAASVGNEAAIGSSARALVRDARAWRAELSLVVAAAPFFAWVPHCGGDFAQYRQFALIADQVLTAVGPSLTLYEALGENLERSGTFGGALITLANENAQEIENARLALEPVKLERARIDEHELSPEAHWILKKADRVLKEWDAALQLLQVAPLLLGEKSPRHYLVLAQNNDELRATGGFISAAGVLRVEHGELSVEWFGDSFAADDLSLIHPPPPAPLQKYMWASQWLLRDANWYADFPTSARIAQRMYERDRHLKTDGVIAVDVRFLPRLVGAMGTVELAGQPLAENNVIALLKASWKPMPPGDMSAAWFSSDRKNFLSELLNGMLARFQAGEVRTTALAQALWSGLREKSVQIFLDDAGAQQTLLDAGWSGAVEPGSGDYLFVVDSNVGFNKVNATVTREIRYNVRLGEQGGEGSVEILYTNPSRAAEGDCDLLKQNKDNTYASMEQSCYWNFVRVLTPRGSQFVSANGAGDAGMTEETESVTAFGGYAIVPRNTVAVVKFMYRLPGSVVHDKMYSLRLQQQAGAGSTPVTVRVELPGGVSVRGTSHPFIWRGEDVLEFHEKVKQDTTIRIFFNP